MGMDIQQVKKLASLARITVSEAELESFAKDIGSIIGFIDQVQKVDLGTVAVPDNQRTNVFRDDIVAPLTPVYDLVEAAPLHQDHFVKVPKVLE